VSSTRKSYEMREMHADLTVMRLRADRLGLADFSALLGIAVLGLKNSFEAREAAPTRAPLESDLPSEISIHAPKPE
jgi:hypothetical protein